MTDAVGQEITELLQAWRQGDEHALERLTPQVYRQLHRAAKRCMTAERDGHSMQTTGLINELYLRPVHMATRFFVPRTSDSGRMTGQPELSTEQVITSGLPTIRQ